MYNLRSTINMESVGVVHYQEPYIAKLKSTWIYNITHNKIFANDFSFFLSL